MTQPPPKPQPSKQQQIVATSQTVSNSGLVAAAIAAGTITQSTVNSIVAAAINAMRAGE